MDVLRLPGLDLRKELRLARTTPAIESGLRAAVGMSVPIAVGFIAGTPALGTVVALGCWFTLLADIGGTYGQKARAMCAGNLVVATAALIGGSVASLPGLTWLVTFAWVLAGGSATRAGVAQTSPRTSTGKPSGT